MAYRKTNTIIPPDYTYIPGGLNTGCQIIIRGRVTCGGCGFDDTRFYLNLQNDNAEGCDVAFHFNPRLGDESVVRNSFQGAWQEEELCIPYFPFQNGGKFTIRIVVHEEYYVVLVNGKHFVHYNHRLSYQDVRYLYLSEGAEYYEVTIQNPCRVPYRGEFPYGLQMGKSVCLQGFVNDDAERFEINFNCDEDGETVGVHFNPRQDQETVVLNTKCDGGWGEEERDQDWFPFQRGQFFDLTFVASDQRLMIYVNDRYFTQYAFRCSSDDIRFLTIDGDVTLMNVDFRDPLPDDHIKEIPSGLEKSDMIVTKGFFYPEGQRFAFNLLYGTSCDGDVGLHFNPRRDDGEVVLNSCDGGAWQEEERHELPATFLDMVPFTVEIVVKSNKYKLYVNGKKFASFRSRGGIEDIRGINVNGDAYIFETKLLRRVERPFVDTLPGPMLEGSWVSIVGTPKKNAERFDINLQCGEDCDYGCDVAFHFNPRFNCEDSVRNTQEGGAWGEEEREQPNFPFEPEDRFEIDILNKGDGYRVFVNKQSYIDYSHRLSPESVKYLMLTGDCNFLEPEFL